MNLIHPLAYIIKFLCDLYLFVLILRLLLQFWRANFYNPVCQLIITLTEPLRPILQRVPMRAEILLLLVILILEYLKISCLLLLQAGAWPAFMGTIVWVVAETGAQIIQVLFFAIILSIILSWLPIPQTQSLREVIMVLTEPLLRPARRLLPLIAGFDLSPLPVLFVLKLLNLMVISPMMAYGAAAALHAI